jgi:(S)-ureidoglycine aminohydrolase
MKRYLRLWCLGGLAVMSASMLAAAATFPVRSMPGGSFVVHAAETTEVKKATSTRADYCDQATATLSRFEVHRTTLQPGAKPHDAHRHEREEMMIVLEGELEVLIEDTKTRIGAGSAFFVVSNDLHGVTNVGEKAATYLVLNFYTPEGTKIPLGKKPAIASTVWEWSELPVKSSPKAERRNFVDAATRTMPKFEMHTTTLHPGAPKHGGKHPDEQFFIMKEGEMEAVAGGQTIRVGPGDLFFATSDQEFGWHHVGDKPSTYYVVRFSTPATPDKPAAH